MKCFVKEQTNQEKKIEKHKAGNSSRKNLTRLKNILDNLTIDLAWNKIFIFDGLKRALLKPLILVRPWLSWLSGHAVEQKWVAFNKQTSDRGSLSITTVRLRPHCRHKWKGVLCNKQAIKRMMNRGSQSVAQSEVCLMQATPFFSSHAVVQSRVVATGTQSRLY